MRSRTPKKEESTNLVAADRRWNSKILNKKGAFGSGYLASLTVVCALRTSGQGSLVSVVLFLRRWLKDISLHGAWIAGNWSFHMSFYKVPVVPDMELIAGPTWMRGRGSLD